ncbi:MAG: ornithine cyclodeaminase family protein [Tepidamorphaceae bacterium]
MRVISSAEIEASITQRGMIEAMRNAFRSHTVAPLRHHHRVARPDRPDSDLLIMPAWTDFAAQGHSGRGYQGVKIVTVTPDNAKFSLPSVVGVYVLMSGETGIPLAMIDGRVLTLLRTSAASALASSYLARADASRLLMVGAGALAPYLIDAHAAVRPITEVLIWNRTPATARKLASAMKLDGIRISATDDLEGAVRGAHIISCATMSETPVVKGAWIEPGAHIDLVGGYRPGMRETDDDTIRKARIFVDTREGVLAEAGDIMQPVEAGVLNVEDIAADLFELTRGEKSGRRFHDQVTLFKSVGSAIEDLAGAIHIFAQL